MKRIFLIFAAFITAFGFILSLASAQQPAPKQHVPGEPILNGQDKAAIIHLDAEVDDMMLRSIKRRVDIAQKLGCGIIIFEISTNGGHIDSALDISKFIKELPARNVTTVAWINNKAYSAGAMIAASCQHVVMTSAAAYGLCAPIAVASTLGGNQLVVLPDAERAKILGPVVQEFNDSAAHNHWDPALLRAMVVVEAQVFQLRNKNSGEFAYVDAEGRTRLLALEETQPDGIKFHPWQDFKVIDDDKSLLTVQADNALAMRLSEATVDSEQQLKGILNIQGELFRLEFNWSERATVFLTTFFIRLVLFVGMLVFAWLELSHPGVSVFGVAALICLVLLVGAPFLTGLAQVWEILLILIGLAIIIADVLIFGGVGMLAVPGFLLMAVGIVASFIPADPGGGIMSSKNLWTAIQHGLGVVVGGSLLAIAAFYALSKYLHVTPGFKRLQLAPGGGAVATAAITVIRDDTDRDATDAVFIGALGRAVSDLRPAGKARFGPHLVAVVSDGGFVAQGAEVSVVEVSGMKVVVKEHAVS